MAELACAVLLCERERDHGALGEAVHEAVAGACRRGDGAPIDQPHVEGTMRPSCTGYSASARSDDRPKRQRLVLGDAGAELIARALRPRTTAARWRQPSHR